MTVIDRPPIAEEATAAHGFRPASRRRTRIAAGVAIAAIAVVGNILVYSAMNDSTEVVQFVDNVAAGELIVSDDVRVIEFGGDVRTANLVPADQIGSIVNRYARTFIPSGSLASVSVVQPQPLVSAGSAVIAITPADGLVPQGLTERSRVQLVLGDASTLIDARVVAVHRDDGGGARSLSVETAEVDAPTVASADEVHLVLLEPGTDPATEAPGG